MENIIISIIHLILSFAITIFCYKKYGKYGLYIWMSVLVIICNIQTTKISEIFGGKTEHFLCCADISKAQHTVYCSEAVQVKMWFYLLLQKVDPEFVLVKLCFINIDTEPGYFMDQIFELVIYLV